MFILNYDYKKVRSEEDRRKIMLILKITILILNYECNLTLEALRTGRRATHIRTCYFYLLA